MFKTIQTWAWTTQVWFHNENYVYGGIYLGNESGERLHYVICNQSLELLKENTGLELSHKQIVILCLTNVTGDTSD